MYLTYFLRFDNFITLFRCRGETREQAQGSCVRAQRAQGCAANASTGGGLTLRECLCRRTKHEACGSAGPGAAALVQGLARTVPGVVARVLWLEEQACCVPVLLAKWICCLLVSCLSAASLGEERERRCWCVCCSAEEGGAGACAAQLR